MRQQLGEVGLGSEQSAGHQDEVGDDCAEGRRGSLQQQHCSADSTDQRGNGQPDDPLPLPNELRPVRERPTGPTPDKGNRRRDVRRERALPGGEQRRERDQRAATRDRVDATGQETGPRDEQVTGDTVNAHVAILVNSAPGEMKTWMRGSGTFAMDSSRQESKYAGSSAERVTTMTVFPAATAVDADSTSGWPSGAGVADSAAASHRAQYAVGVGSREPKMMHG